MNRFSFAALAVAAGGITSVGVAGGPGLLDGGFGSTRVAGHLYVNAVTGEVVRTPGTSRISDLYWQNDGGCGFFFAQDDPARNTAATGIQSFGTLAVHWGDVPGAVTDGYDVAYATNIGSDTLGAGVVGLNMTNIFLDSYDGGLDPGGAGSVGIGGFILSDIAGGDQTLGTSLFQGWIYTVDLEGGFEFAWGDASGGLTDLDGDGLHDFGYGFTFEQEQAEPKGVVGPFLAWPASLGGTGTATGCPDLFDWFNPPDDTYIGAFWFGGGDCTSAAKRPYASFTLNLYGTVTSPCSVIDYNGDGLIDFGDYLEFLNRYDAQDLSADLNGDGLVDFGDYLEFLNLFDACQ